jgi:glycosyltransferase involved in cell wall biosynthesis
MKEFPVSEKKITIIRHGMNNKVSVKGLPTDEARKTLNLGQSDKVVLFFGNIDFYKGVDLLLDSLEFIPFPLKNEIRVIIAGNAKSKEYSELIKKKISDSHLENKINTHIHHIPDNEVETFFVAADCIVLPYRNIYQSGVIFLSYTFGLPVIVPDIGNFRNDIELGKTGFLAASNGPQELAAAIVDFFGSQVFLNHEISREYIKQWASERYSWESIGKDIHNLYKSLVN